MNQILKDNGMTLAAAPKSKSGPLSKEKKNQKLEGYDRYDWSRVERPDPRDPRGKGSPCFGVHIPQEPQGVAPRAAPTLTPDASCAANVSSAFSMSQPTVQWVSTAQRGH